MHGVNGGKPRGMLYAGGDIFQTDLPGQTMTKDAVRNLGSTAGQEQTYTCVPSGSGTRIAIDRDEDTLFNGVETNTGTFVNALDTGTNPAAAKRTATASTTPGRLQRRSRTRTTRWTSRGRRSPQCQRSVLRA